MKRTYLIPLFTLLCLSISYAAPLYAKEHKKSEKQRKRENKQSLAKFNKLYNYLNNNYIDPIDGEKLVELSINAMLEHLDPYSRYIDEQNSAQVTELGEGEITGIGIQTRMVNDTVCIEALTKGAPAERAGLMVYDQIIGIDGESASGVTAERLSHMIRGKRGTNVALSVIRGDSPTPLEFIIKRGIVPITTIDSAYTIADGVGYIRINRFARSMFGEFLSSYKSLGSPKSLILDFRDNPGGFLNEALRLSSFFLPAKSLVLSVKKGDNESPREVNIKRGADSLDIRVVILINEKSASASELVAGALQDWDRAVVVGRRSHGKGLIQRIIQFKGGSLAYIVHSEYLTPSGRAIQLPYESGNIEQYKQSRIDRIKLDEADSIAGNDSLPYYTLRLARKVYGGGGIYPDFHIVSEPTIHLPYIYALFQNDIFNTFSYNYLRESQAQLLELYPDIDNFLTNFSVDQAMVDQLVAFAIERGVDAREEEIVGACEQIKQCLTREITYRLWGKSGEQKWQNIDNRDVQRALELFENWESQSPIASAGSLLDWIIQGEDGRSWLPEEP